MDPKGRQKYVMSNLDTLHPKIDTNAFTFDKLPTSATKSSEAR